MMYSGVGSGLEKEGGISPQEDRNFLGVIFLYIYVLFECKPIVEAAWGFKQCDVPSNNRLWQVNASILSGYEGTKRGTEPSYLHVLLF